MDTIAAPTNVETIAAPLAPPSRALIERARAHLDESWMTELLCRLVETPSPYGEERAIADLLAQRMADCGLDAYAQRIDSESANAIGRWKGAGGGPSVLVFAPLDSPFSGRESDEVPWVGEFVPPHMRPKALVVDGGVTGLSADNPKASITAAIAAVHALRRAAGETRLRGDIVLAFGAGGAPANARPGMERMNVGHGAGCDYLLKHGVRGDFAIIVKPGYAVAWEEVGLTWFRIRVRGIQTYVGRRHFLAYRNPIVDAAKLVQGLDAWFAEYSSKHRSGLCTPQGAVSAIEGGWTYKPSFIPAACDLYVDLRITPRTTPEQAKRALEAAIAGIKAANPGLDCDVEMIVALPGMATDPRNWIIQSSIRGWEDVEKRPHKPFLETSGQTEAVILRAHGIPTARMGLPTPMGQTTERPKHTMGMVQIADIRRFAEVLIYTLVDTCSRTLAEIDA